LEMGSLFGIAIALVSGDSARYDSAQMFSQVRP